MPVVRCDLTKLKGRVIAALNAAPASAWATTLTASDDTRRNTTEIENAILAADAQVCVAHAETLGDGHRSLFLVETELTHGAKVPDHLGPIEMVRIEPYDGAAKIAGLVADADDIDSMRANVESIYDSIPHDEEGSSLAGFWKVIGDEIHYTGFSAWALLAVFTRTGACQAPESDEDLVFSIAMMNLPKEGDSGAFFSAFAGQAQQGLGRIRTGAMLVPPVQSAVQA